jgi:Cytochrome P450
MADLTTPNTRRSATPVPTRGALAGTDSDMSDTADPAVSAHISLLPRAPKNPLSYRQQLQYLPFGGGPRSCIGDHFSMLEAALALATSIRRIEIRSAEDLFRIAVPLPSPRHLPGPASPPSTHNQGSARPVFGQRHYVWPLGGANYANEAVRPGRKARRRDAAVTAL